MSEIENIEPICRDVCLPLSNMGQLLKSLMPTVTKAYLSQIIMAKITLNPDLKTT